MNEVPAKFLETLYRIEREVIFHVERLIDNNLTIFTHLHIFNRLSGLSEKISKYENFVLYEDFFLDEIDRASIYHVLLHHIALSKELSETEKLNLKEISKYYSENDSHHYHGKYDIYYINYTENPARKLSINNIGHPVNISHEVGPTGLICAEFYFEAIGKAYGNEDLLEYVAVQVANDYLREAIATILLTVEERHIKTGFLLRELYKLTRHYTIEDIDRHLTTDIPELPCSTDYSELKGAFFYSDSSYNYYEVLFITTDGFYSVKRVLDMQSREMVILKNLYAENDSSDVFGVETHFSEMGLTLMEMILFDQKDLLRVDSFNVDEVELIKAVNDDRASYFKEELMDFYTLHKGAWITAKWPIRTSFRPKLRGIQND